MIARPTLGLLVLLLLSPAAHAQQPATATDSAAIAMGAELVVLVQTPSGCRIKAIHWSSRRQTR